MIFSRLKIISTVIFVAVMAVSAIAQSTINYPQAVFQYQTTIPFKGDNSETFYSFVGKGNVSITLDLKANSDNAGVYVDFLNPKGRSLTPQEVVQATNNGTDRVVKNLSLGRKYQTVIIKLKSIAYGSRNSYPGSLKIGLNGDFNGLERSYDDSVGSASQDIDFDTTTDLDWFGKSIGSPRMINTRYSNLNFKGDNKEQFVAFYGQGNVEITYDLKANATNAGVNIILLDKNSEELSPQKLAQATNYGTDRVTQSIELDKRQLVIIKIVSIAYGSNASYKGNLKISLNQGFSR